MAALTWTSVDRPYLAGLDNGVLYPEVGPGVAWNGLVSINEQPSEVLDTEHYLEGVRIAITETNEDFDFSLSAYAYPREFEPCAGFDGIYDNQVPETFGLCYRVGDSTTGQLHLIYHATAKPSDRNWETLSDRSDAALFTWDVTTKPLVHPEIAPTAHIIVELSMIYPTVRTALFNILYGTSGTNPRLPEFIELYGLFADNALFVVVDNGDGTWTATGPDTAIQMLDSTTFQITWPSAVFINSTTYTLTSY